MHGFAWAWAAGWFWGWLIVAVALAPVVGRRLAGGYDGRHILPDMQEEYDAWVAEQGSMILAEERPLEPLPAPTVDPEPWRQQIADDLAPETLDDPPAGSYVEHLRHIDEAWRATWPDERDEIVLPAYGGWISGPCLDPGPGDAAVEPPASPGPDHWQSCPVHADICGDCPPGGCAAAEPSGRWLEQQLAILYEWVREQHAIGASA